MQLGHYAFARASTFRRRSSIPLDSSQSIWFLPKTASVFSSGCQSISSGRLLPVVVVILIGILCCPCWTTHKYRKTYGFPSALRFCPRAAPAMSSFSTNPLVTISQVAVSWPGNLLFVLSSWPGNFQACFLQFILICIPSR